MMMLLYPLEGEIEGYSRDQFLEDCVDECEKDIRQCFDAGAVRVSVDFTEGRLANKNDSRNPWTGKNMLQEFIDLNNRLFDRFSPEERKNIGIHTCPGGDCDSVHSKEVPNELLLEHMFDMNAGYFLIQCASEEDRDKVYELCGRYSREDADGVAQVCFMGVIDPLNPEVETPEHVRDELLKAAKHIPVERLGATDDCGFSPFSRDVKPGTARRTSPATWRCRRSRRGSKGRGWPRSELEHRCPPLDWVSRLAPASDRRVSSDLKKGRAVGGHVYDMIVVGAVPARGCCGVPGGARPGDGIVSSHSIGTASPM